MSSLPEYLQKAPSQLGKRLVQPSKSCTAYGRSSKVCQPAFCNLGSRFLPPHTFFISRQSGEIVHPFLHTVGYNSASASAGRELQLPVCGHRNPHLAGCTASIQRPTCSPCPAAGTSQGSIHALDQAHRYLFLDMFPIYDICARGVISMASGWLSGLTNIPALVLILDAPFHNLRRLIQG